MENITYEMINQAGIIGTQELLLILAIAILLFGGSRLAGLGKAMGKSVREFKEEVGMDKDSSDKVSEVASSKSEDKTEE